MKKIIFSILVCLVLLPIGPVFAAEGLIYGYNKNIELGDGENAFYGVITGTSNANSSLIKLQSPQGTDRFSVSRDGQIRGYEICDEDATECHDLSDGWAAVGGTNLWSTSGSDIYYNGGEVGIGATNPSSALTINRGDENGLRIENDDNNETAGIRFRSKNASGQNLHADIVVDAGNGGAEQGYMGFEVPYSAAPKMVIEHTGNVGIGTVSPAQRLHVVGSNLLATFENTNTVANNYSQILIKAGSATNYIWTANQNSTSWGGANSLNIYAGTGGAMTLWTNATEKVRITTGGNVGIGITAPTQKLDVNGTIRTRGDFLADANYGLGLVGLYSATRYQNVFAMGTSYRLSANGITPGNLYGIAWTHTNIGGQSKPGLSHQALFMNNGDTQTAIGTGIWTKGVITVANGNNSLAVFGPNSTYSSYLTVGASNTGKITTTKAAVITTNGNLHLDSALNRYTYINYYSKTDTFLNLQGGNVGIGTASPFDKLTITGRLRFGTNAASHQNAGAGAVAGDPTHGIGWGNQPLDEYGIYVGPQETIYAGNYTKLVLNWHTGLKIGAATGYGGVTFWSNAMYTAPSELFSVGRGDNNVRVNNLLLVNGGSSSNWGSLNIGGTNSINAAGNIYSYSRICAGNASGNCNSTGGVVISPSGSNVYGSTYITGSGNSYFNGGNVGMGTTNPGVYKLYVGDGDNIQEAGEDVRIEGSLVLGNTANAPRISGCDGCRFTRGVQIEDNLETMGRIHSRQGLTVYAGGITSAAPIATTLGGYGNAGVLQMGYHTLSSHSNGWMYMGDQNTNVYGGRGLAVHQYYVGASGTYFQESSGRLYINDPNGVYMNGMLTFDADIENKINIYGGNTNHTIGIESGGMVFRTDNHISFRASTGASIFRVIAGGKVAVNYDSNGSSYNLYVNGSAYALNGWTSSDVRWKKNINNLENSLDKVNKLRGVNYEWKINEYPDMNFTEGTQVGLIAQEVEEVIPELVSTDDDGYKAVSYEKLTVVLLEAIKELKSSNEDLIKRVEELEK